MEVHLRIVPGINLALMLVTPYDKVQELCQEFFRKVSLFGICVTKNSLRWCSRSWAWEGDILVLMNTHEVEPILLLHSWSEELDFLISKCPE